MYRRATSPFGYAIDAHLGTIRAPCGVSTESYTLKNPILGFERDGKPVFKNPKKKCTLGEQHGMLVRVREKNWFTSLFHTTHTISLFSMAFDILKELYKQPHAYVGTGDGVEKQINIQDAIFHPRKKSSVWLNCRHRGQKVVIKSTSDPYMKLRYILDGTIHYLLERCCPTYVPKLHFVSLMDNGDVAICSEQLQIPSLYEWISKTLIETRPRRFWNRALWFMMRNVCRAIQRMQQRANFTHRDCHANNVYYDMENKRILFIDFDWSSICVNGKVVSEPRFLYDTTRNDYANNRSLDCCILFRSIVDILMLRNNELNGAFDPFLEHVYFPLFRRYEEESGRVLKRDCAYSKAAIQLYKINTADKKMNGLFGHGYGMAHTKKEYEYKMGWQQWDCMTPESILAFLNKRRHFIFNKSNF